MWFKTYSSPSPPSDHPPIKRLPLLNLLFLKYRITKEAFLPSIPKKSSFNVQTVTQYFRVFLRKIFNISIDDVIGKPLDITKYVCPRSGRSVKRLYLFRSHDYLGLNSYFGIYDSYNFPNEMWGLLLFRNKRKSVDINRDSAKRNSYPKGPRQGPRTCTNKWTLTGVHT